MNIDITWFLTAISLLGSFLNAKKKVSCFYLWAIGEIMWCVLDISNGVYGRATLDVVSFIMALYGIYEWKHTKI